MATFYPVILSTPAYTLPKVPAPSNLLAIISYLLTSLLLTYVMIGLSFLLLFIIFVVV